MGLPGASLLAQSEKALCPVSKQDAACLTFLFTTLSLLHSPASPERTLTHPAKPSPTIPLPQKLPLCWGTICSKGSSHFLQCWTRDGSDLGTHNIQARLGLLGSPEHSLDTSIKQCQLAARQGTTAVGRAQACGGAPRADHHLEQLLRPSGVMRPCPLAPRA